MKDIIHLIYVWTSTVLFIALIFLLATVPNLAVDGEGSEVIKVTYRVLLYFLLYILIYRAIIATLRNTVTRLSAWHSKQEKHEDTEFALLVDALVTIISVLLATLIAVIDEFIQFEMAVEGRTASVEDVLVSVLAIITAAIVSFAMPVFGELEVWFVQKTKKLFKKKN